MQWLEVSLRPMAALSKLSPTRALRHGMVSRQAPEPVGASLLAKADFQTLHLQQMYRPLREQLPAEMCGLG
jgi:hypothetical protein